MMKAWMCAAAALALLAGCASDNGRPGQEHQTVRALLSVDALMFAGFDSDNDLRITNAEIEAGITREFARADTNHDGTISPLEFQAWSNVALGGGQTAPYRIDFDHNVDNVITAAEFHDEIVARAHEYDTNEDGVLTRDEFVRVLNQARGPLGGPDGSQRRQRPNGGGFPGGR